MNPLLEGAFHGALIALVLVPIIYFSIRKRDHAVDRIQMTQLSAKGINLEKPREVEFALFVRTEASAAHITEQLIAEGYSARYEAGKIELRAKRGAQATSEEGHVIVATKVVVLYGDTLRLVRTHFSALAEKENGMYIGWQAKDLSP
jgi:Regulator of ribonuclease activity B